VTIGGQIAVLAQLGASVRALPYHGDGSLLAAPAGHTIMLSDPVTSAPAGRFERHTADIRARPHRPARTLLASAGDDHTIRLWDLVSATPLAVLEGHRAPVVDLAFSPDAAWIASASEDGTVRLWNSASGGSVTLTQHDAPVRALAFAP